jgi:hypothetical protein
MKQTMNEIRERFLYELSRNPSFNDADLKYIQELYDLISSDIYLTKLSQLMDRQR